MLHFLNNTHSYVMHKRFKKYCFNFIYYIHNDIQHLKINLMCKIFCEYSYTLIFSKRMFL